MARTHWAVALTAACIALLATINLYWYLSWTTHEYLISNSDPYFASSQNPLHDSKLSNSPENAYLIGVGKADITGPVTEIEFMGYADPDQLGTGVRQRLYTRAFIVGDSADPRDRFVYLVQDIQSGDTAVRNGILQGLKELGPDFDVYGQQNVAVTGTHSHSGPGAWLNYLLPQIPSKGFNKQSYEAIVQGSIRAIQIAHESLQPGSLHLGSIKVPGANINRSPFSYEHNSEEERARYDEDVDSDLSLLRFQSASSGKDIGVLTWYATHGTSMHNNNTLVTGDNKGVAASLFEAYARDAKSAAPGLVAGFSQSNVGDTSPNILGAYCESGPQEGQLCDYKTSLCAGKALPCHARGSHWGLNDAGSASTFENGRRQYVSARKLYEAMASRPDSYTTIAPSTVKAMHVFVDFSNRTFTLPNGTLVSTCPAAMGYSFAAGTSDGPGNRDFKQHNPGDPDANPLWEVVRNRIHKPGPEQIACQFPKPILLDVGETLSPYLWTPNIVDVQFFRAGTLFIIVSPGEATTMAGRRWRDVVRSSAESLLPEDTQPYVLLGGPANSYTHYITTREEYAVQRYEGASTLYGPHTLESYLDLTRLFIPYLSAEASTSPSLPPWLSSLPALGPGPDPPIHVNASYSFITPVVRDSPGLFGTFGALVSDVDPSYPLASPGVAIQASFTGANPRNNLRLGETFAAVERWDAHSSSWTRFRDDNDWSLVFAWERTSTALATSRVTIRWELDWELGRWGQRAGAQVDDGAGDAGGVKTELSKKRRRSDPLAISGGKVLGFEGDYSTPYQLRGRYRIRYYGDSKSLAGRIEAFEGVSSEFELV